jgi:4-phospho-D-threonate 3-dehydrogenase / 4-phospho-D-erythronate 3-dehydrogenase
VRSSIPILGITLGDPTGIGPEITVRAIASGIVQQECTPIVLGRSEIVRRAIELCHLDLLVDVANSWDQVQSLLDTQTRDNRTQNVGTCDQSPPRMVCLQTGSADADAVIGAVIDARGGQSAYDGLVTGASLCMESKLDALVTSPLQKKALHLAGHDWPGHTELLAHLCGAKESAMMLYLPPGKPLHGGPAGFGVVHVTLHMALRDVFAALTTENIFEKIELTHHYFSRLLAGLGLPDRPRIAVAALNPHGGESGRFGDEEDRLIRPAVDHAVAKGYDVSGPYPVDTLMPRAARGEFDAVVAMYHDQGHIALKLIDMFEAVNITLGLPIIRTSVAHGTAHDIAWQGKADCGGMIQAILAAARLAKSRSAIT